MIQIETFETGQVVKFRLANKVPGQSPYYTAAYWVDGLLVDTGCAHTAQELISALGRWPVKVVVNTHSHEDHIGANAGVQEVFGCPILAHPDALPILDDPRLQPLQPYRRLFWGRPRPSSGEPVGEEVETTKFHFQVIHTPGHSLDHICLFEPDQGWLFSGDAYIGGQDRALRQGYDIYGIISSLKKLAALPVRTIFSGSGSVRDNGGELLQEKIAYLEELGERIRSLGKEGLSARRICRQVLGPKLQITYLTLGHFSGRRLVESYLAGPIQPEAIEVPADIEQEGTRPRPDQPDLDAPDQPESTQEPIN